MQWIRTHLSSAHVIAMIALFVALGGTTYAAVVLPKNSVKAKQIATNAVGASEIKSRAVGTSEVRNGRLLAEDFRAGQLPAGAKGDKGDPGDPGRPGRGRRRAGRVRPRRVRRVDATLRHARAERCGPPPRTRESCRPTWLRARQGLLPAPPASTCRRGRRARVVSLDNADAAVANRNLIASVAIDRGEDLGDCPATHNDARVRIVDGSSEAAQNARFFIWFEL